MKRIYFSADANESGSGVINNTQTETVSTPAGDVDKQDDKTPLTIVKPVEHDELVTIKNVGNVITRNERDFVMVEIVGSDGKSEAFPVSSAMTTMITELRKLVGKPATCHFERTIAGKTQWLNKETGAIGTHKNTGVALRRVSPATEQEQLLSNKKALFGLMEELGLETRITKANPDDKNALSTLYGSILR